MDEVKDPSQEQPMGEGMPQPEGAPEGGEQTPETGMPTEGGNDGGAEVPGAETNQSGETPEQPA